MIGRLPGTLPGRPERSQNLPGELPRTLRAPRALQDPQDVLGITKPKENQETNKQNRITRIRTIENQTEYQETFKNTNNDRLHLHVTGHIPTKR